MAGFLRVARPVFQDDACPEKVARWVSRDLPAPLTNRARQSRLAEMAAPVCLLVVCLFQMVKRSLPPEL